MPFICSSFFAILFHCSQKYRQIWISFFHSFGLHYFHFLRHLRKSAQIRAKTAIFAVKDACIRNSSCCHFSIFQKGASKRRTHFFIHSPVIRPHFFHNSSFFQKRANSFFHPFAVIARSSAVLNTTYRNGCLLLWIYGCGMTSKGSADLPC